MRAEPDPLPAEAGDKFPIDFGGLGLGSGSSVAGGQPWGSPPPQSAQSHPQPLLSRGPGGPRR